jgi:hypothetical protein
MSIAASAARPLRLVGRFDADQTDLAAIVEAKAAGVDHVRDTALALRFEIAAGGKRAATRESDAAERRGAVHDPCSRTHQHQCMFSHSNHSA